MHASFYALLTQTVTFKPLLAGTVRGPGGHGPATAPVRCRISTPTPARRRIDQPGTERIDSTAVVYLAPDDFDAAVVRVGALCSTPDGDYAPIVAIDAPKAEDGRVDHYRITVGSG